jgi:D-alanyl-D-alanine carboxypeptidase
MIKKKILIFLGIVVFVIFLISFFFPLFNNKNGILKNIMQSNLSPKEQNFKNTSQELHKIYERNLNVLDPKVQAQGLIAEVLDSQDFLYKKNIYTIWPLASLTKLITATVVLENIKNIDQVPITITTSTQNIEDGSGKLITGEIYKASDLLKIMLMASSNRAAESFKEYFGQEKFLNLAKSTISKIGMTQTVIYDASGLDDRNTGTPFDTLLLLKYILENYPQILTWTRISNLSFQPLNSTRINVIQNINPLNERADFLGGKTGTSPLAKENLAAVLQFKNLKLGIVIMGSQNRFSDLDTILNWIDKAYQF